VSGSPARELGHLPCRDTPKAVMGVVVCISSIEASISTIVLSRPSRRCSLYRGPQVCGTNLGRASDPVSAERSTSVARAIHAEIQHPKADPDYGLA
jgi:hypothetical protein